MIDLQARLDATPNGEALLIEAPVGEGFRVLNACHEIAARSGAAGTLSMSLLVGVDTLTRRVCDVVRIVRVVAG